MMMTLMTILIENMSDAEATHIYITHLHENLAIEVRKSKATTLAAVIEAAQEAEEILSSGRRG